MRDHAEDGGGQIRFAADSNVGRLARWLRALGFDVTYEAAILDRELVARALAEARVLLTRDADLMNRRLITAGTVRAVLLRDDRVLEQLRQVVGDLELASGGLAGLLQQSLTRCLRCNVELVPRSRSGVRHRVPARVLATQERFRECPSCSRLYWPGSHWRRMRERMALL